MCLRQVRGMGLVGEELRHRATELRRESGFNWGRLMQAQVLPRGVFTCGAGWGATVHGVV